MGILATILAHKAILAGIAAFAAARHHYKK